jgi:carboxymethylenebutenolidase
MPTLTIDSKPGSFQTPILIPEASKLPAAALILFPAIAGVNDYVLRRAQQLQGAGYVVLVLDYYAREGHPPDVSTPEKIGAAVEALSDVRVLSDAADTVAALKRTASIDPDRIGTLGFCIGGTYAMLAGCESLGLRASVNYYGAIRYRRPSATKPHSPIERLGTLACPLLGHFGTFDRLISLEDCDALERALQGYAKPYELFRYRGAPHAFDEDFRPVVYRPAAAHAAWQHTMVFLEWYLRQKT